jgi:hypothetical protein
VTRAPGFLLAFSLTATLLADPVRIAPRTIVEDTFSRMTRLSVSAATNGSSFAVAWEDRLFVAFPPGGVMVRTLSAEGVPEQPLPVAIGYGAVQPAIAWNGSEWVVADTQWIGRFALFRESKLEATTLFPDTLQPHEHAIVASGCMPKENFARALSDGPVSTVSR